MPLAILSDVHANIEALRAVLDEIDARGVDQIVCLGDLVGYFADPDACVDLVRERCAIVLAGNHDRVACGMKEPTDFGLRARTTIAWTIANISDRTRRYLASLPGLFVEPGRFVAVHAALSPEPNDEVYLTERDEILASLDALANGSFDANVAFFGHTHRPAMHARRGPRPIGRAVSLPSDEPILVNPGSVGQPRDGDARAAFAIVDFDRREIEFHRVAFDLDKTLAKARRAGLLEHATFLGRSIRRVRAIARRLV